MATRGSPCARPLRARWKASPARDSNCMSASHDSAAHLPIVTPAAWRRRLTQGRRDSPAPTVRAHRVVADIFNCKLSNNDVQPPHSATMCSPARTMLSSFQPAYFPHFLETKLAGRAHRVRNGRAVRHVQPGLSTAFVVTNRTLASNCTLTATTVTRICRSFRCGAMA